jgi:hypothetical protein
MPPGNQAKTPPHYFFSFLEKKAAKWRPGVAFASPDMLYYRFLTLSAGQFYALAPKQRNLATKAPRARE